MPIPEFKRFDVFQQIPDSIDVARELSLELEMRAESRNETLTLEEISEAVRIMNHHLIGVGGRKSSYIKADNVYLNIPNHELEAELIPDAEIAQARVENALVRGCIESFHWLGSTAVLGFGVQLYGTELIEPYRGFASTAFVPVDAISAHLAA